MVTSDGTSGTKREKRPMGMRMAYCQIKNPHTIFSPLQSSSPAVKKTCGVVEGTMMMMSRVSNGTSER